MKRVKSFEQMQHIAKTNSKKRRHPWYIEADCQSIMYYAQFCVTIMPCMPFFSIQLPFVPFCIYTWSTLSYVSGCHLFSTSERSSDVLVVYWFLPSSLFVFDIDRCRVVVHSTHTHTRVCVVRICWWTWWWWIWAIWR
jgi:hypothetical protein